MSDDRVATLGFPLAPWIEVPVESLVRSKRDEFGKLFLSLALAYNDYKGVILLERALNDIGRPDAHDVTPAAGEWHGIAIQTQRLMAVITSGVLEVLNMNQRSLGDLEMATVLAGMRRDVIPDWRWLVDAATEGKSKKARELLSTVRSKLTAHYCVKDPIWRGLRKRFREEPKNRWNFTCRERRSVAPFPKRASTTLTRQSRRRWKWPTRTTTAHAPTIASCGWRATRSPRSVRPSPRSSWCGATLTRRRGDVGSR